MLHLRDGLVLLELGAETCLTKLQHKLLFGDYDRTTVEEFVVCLAVEPILVEKTG